VQDEKVLVKKRLRLAFVMAVLRHSAAAVIGPTFADLRQCPANNA